MANIILHSNNPNSSTSVSNIFIDEYMSDANGEFVKIYLYLLRLMNIPNAAFSISSIADKFEHTEKDIKRALSYWERMNLLRLEYDDQQNLTGICLLDSVSRNSDRALGMPAEDASAVSPADIPPVQPDPVSPSMEASPEAPMTAGGNDVRSQIPASAGTVSAGSPLAEEPSAKKTYSRDDIKQFRQNEAVAELFFIAERYLGRTLSATDIQTILYLYDGLGFSTDLIEYLIESCVNSRHTSIRYIEKTALHWADNHISTVEEAKQADNIHSKAYYTVMKSFGISGRSLVPAEMEFLKKWTAEFGFSDELISEACQRTIQAVHQPNFNYADSILSSWHKKQIRNLSDIARLDAEHQSKKKITVTANAASAPSKNKFNNFTQRSYDYDQLEKMLLTTTVQ